MNRKNTTAFLTAAMLSMAFVPTTSADPGCEKPGPGATNPCDHYEQVSLALGVTIWGQGTYSIGFCDEVFGISNPTGDFHCDPSPGLFGSGGAAFIDVSSWNVHPPSTISQARDIHINVEYAQDSGLDMDGFHIMACTDRDDDNACSNSDPDGNSNNNDALLGAYANGHSLEAEGECKKDTKDDQCDGTTAELTFCVERDGDSLGLFPDGGWDDIWVFISAWVKESVTGLTAENNEAIDWGTTVGSFDVYATDLAFHDDFERCRAQDGVGSIEGGQGSILIDP